MSVGVLSHPDCVLHEMGPGHPESPLRISAIQDQLIASGLDALLRHYVAPLAPRAALERVHTPAYVAQLFAAAPATGYRYIDPDTTMNPHTLAAALRAAGAALEAVDRVMAREVSAAFCNVRPPGHHAERDRAMGFCFFNNVAVAAAHALEHHRLERVAIVDFDVHHGNGTEDIFQDEPRVLLCSSFQHPFYPYSDAHSRPHIVKMPLAAGSGSAEFRAAMETHCLPALADFAPEFVFFSAGFDAHADDPLASLGLTENDYGWITTQVKNLTERQAGGRIVSVLEGGYDLSALGRSVAAHLKALLA
jgi:acetoin utilization deacetylase AcuC-like enzyme